MPSDKNPVFRKAIIPWYHSKAAYFVVIFFMLQVLLFGIAGISVARNFSQYSNYIWLPILLVALSGVLIISTTIRFVKRYVYK
ncbi:MAG: hypothetical protein PVG70_02770 [Desulfobacterales bacterium]|jgi:hypothetical protein